MDQLQNSSVDLEFQNGSIRKKFHNQIMDGVCKWLGIHRTETTPYRPQSDGFSQESVEATAILSVDPTPPGLTGVVALDLLEVTRNELPSMEVTEGLEDSSLFVDSGESDPESSDHETEVDSDPQAEAAEDSRSSDDEPLVWSKRSSVPSTSADPTHHGVPGSGNEGTSGFQDGPLKPLEVIERNSYRTRRRCLWT